MGIWIYKIRTINEVEDAIGLAFYKRKMEV